MRDKNISAVYLNLATDLTVTRGEVSIGDMFGTPHPNDALYFSFESRFEPFNSFVHDELKAIDLVVRKNADTGGNKDFIRPLEVKLTTLPDNTTEGSSDEGYGCEIVVRSPTMRYMALSMADSLAERFAEVRKIFEPACIKIRSWDNAVEMKACMPAILEALEIFLAGYCQHQKPLLVQPVWKTKGKLPVLADDCLDIFVWSDFALTRLFMESAKEVRAPKGDDPKISRQQRAALRLARFLFEVSQSGKVYQAPIYDGMNFGYQNDKEFAISGNKTHAFMSCNRLTKPIVRKKQIKDIILGGGQKYLSPERRFDAILYFSTGLFD